MQIEASVANKLILALSSDDEWELQELHHHDRVVFYHRYSGTYWRLEFEGIWADWLAEKIMCCGECQRPMITWFDLDQVNYAQS